MFREAVQNSMDAILTQTVRYNTLMRRGERADRVAHYQPRIQWRVGHLPFDIPVSEKLAYHVYKRRHPDPPKANPYDVGGDVDVDVGVSDIKGDGGPPASLPRPPVPSWLDEYDRVRLLKKHVLAAKGDLFFEVVDNGCGMERDTILVKLMQMGASVKPVGSVGGF